METRGPLGANQRSRVRITLNPYSCASGNSDPFTSTTVPLDGQRLDVVAYIRSLSILINWPAELATKGGQRHLVAAFWAKSQVYFEYKMVMHSYLAFAFSLMALVHPREKEALHRICGQHYQQAVSLLRGLVESFELASDQIMTAFHTVTCLAIADFYRLGWLGSTMHRQALKRIIYLIGGFNRLHWVYQDMITNVYTSASALRQVRCELPLDSFDPGPFRVEQDSWAAAEHSQTTPPTLENPRAEPSHSSELIKTFALFRELAPIEAQKRNPGIPEAEYQKLQQLFRWSHLRRTVLRATIGDYWHTIAIQTKAVDEIDDNTWFAHRAIHQVSLEMCLCLAAHLSYYLVFFGVFQQLQAHGGFQFVLVLLLRCVARLEVDPGTIDSTDPRRKDLLWILAVGAHAEDNTASFGGCSSIEIADGRPPYAPRWFSMRFGVLARRLGYTSVQDLAMLFESAYVYDATIHGHVYDRLIEFQW